MALLTWEDSYSVGVKEIDGQHQKMFGIINRLYDSMNAAKDTENLPQILKELVDYATFHFSTEEKYFVKFNYEDSAEHINFHHMYSGRVDHFIKDYEVQNSLLSFEILDFLKDWWINHINGEDKKYTECFHQHGLF